MGYRYVVVGAGMQGTAAAFDLAAFGEGESVKATRDLYCGIDGEVVEVNQAVLDDPETINRDCYGDGWILRVRPADAAQLETLLSAQDYAAANT